MTSYQETLKRLFDTLPDIAKSEAMTGHDKVISEIWCAYTHLDTALTRLIIEK